jgi:hypothetical protein
MTYLFPATANCQDLFFQSRGKLNQYTFKTHEYPKKNNSFIRNHKKGRKVNKIIFAEVVPLSLHAKHPEIIPPTRAWRRRDNQSRSPGDDKYASVSAPRTGEAMSEFF